GLGARRAGVGVRASRQRRDPGVARAAAALLQPLQRAREPRHEERERRHAYARPRGSARSTAPAAAAGHPAAVARGRSAATARRQRRTVPGTNPSGMKTTITTKIAPSTKFQRSMWALATFLTTTTSAAPVIGPSRVAVPPAITIRSASADAVSATACGLTNWL